MSNVHHGREDVNDGRAQKGTRERRSEPQIAHLEGNANGDRHRPDGNHVERRLGGAVETQQGEGARPEAREDEGEAKDDGREHAAAREEGEGVTRGVVVEDEAHGGAAEGEEARGHDESGDGESAEETRLGELGELGETVADHCEELGGVIVRHVGGVEHGYEDESLEGGGRGAERGLLGGAQGLVEGGTLGVGAGEVAV
mmetsp:Transcript_44406/g.111205  ORF Transcript_44406/g.111205 Transcript_44406/m.111205 type:complete len:200 (+) Transcript_44406:347-946(+)